MATVKKDYRPYLSKVAKQMILVHDADVLVKLVIRTLMRTVGVRHAGMFLYNKNKKEYVIKISGGKKGLKIPVNFAKIKPNNPIIKFFYEKALSGGVGNYLTRRGIETLKKEYSNFKEILSFLEDLKDEMSFYKAEVVVPGFFRKNLVVVFFIGSKYDGSVFTLEDMDFLTVLASDVVMAIQNAKLFEDIKHQLDINKKLLVNTVETLITALDKKNAYTHGHAERVMKYSMILLKYMPYKIKEKYKDFDESLQMAALLHDIGKIGIPEEILNKESKLSEKEIVFIRKHPLMGAEILEPIEEFKNISLGVKYHHEKYDGTGYPCGLTGEKIPYIASIISVADVYDAMLSDRPYRKGMKKSIVINEIKNNKNKQFNPVVVDAFLEAVANKEM